MRVLIAIFVISWQVSGAQKTEVRSLDTFRAIRVTSGIEVKLIKGDRPSARVEASGISLSEVITEVQGNTLKIGFRSIRLDGRNDVHVQVTYTDLDRITALAAASVISNDVLEAEALELSASAAASIEVEVKTRRLSADATTASAIILSGTAGEVHMDATTSSTIDAYHLETDNVSANASTASDIRVTVRKEIKAEASTAGSIRYKGDPARSNTAATTAGSIRKVN
ncbi:MAG: head GIN domain-containing protein [Bacteroidota bacterium]